MILDSFLAIAEEFQLKGLMRPMNYDEVDKEEILGKEIVKSLSHSGENSKNDRPGDDCTLRSV